MKRIILLVFTLLFAITAIVWAADQKDPSTPSKQSAKVADKKAPAIPAGTPMVLQRMDDSRWCICIPHNCCCGSPGQRCTWCGGPHTCVQE